MALGYPHLIGWLDMGPDPKNPGEMIPVLIEGAPAEAQEEYKQFLARIEEEKRNAEPVCTNNPEDVPELLQDKNAKAILITRDRYDSTERAVREFSFSLTFTEENPEAVLFDDQRRMVPSEAAVQFWNELEETVNLQKVLSESKKRIGEGTYDYQLHLSNGESILHLAFWDNGPGDSDPYTMTETYKLRGLVEMLVEKLNIARWDE